MIPALEVVTGNVNVGSLPTINMGQVEGGEVEKFHSPEVLILVRSMLR